MAPNLSLITTFSALLPFIGVVSAEGKGMGSAVNYLFKRQCAQCPAEVKATCPSCPAGSYCSLTVDACGCTKAMCIDSTGKLKEPPGKPNVGAIAGGVVAALVITAIIAFFFLRSMKRKRELREEAEARAEKSRSLRHSQASISTTTTRASNVIQIGFIPGVNGRSGPSTPGLVPPVPAIPDGLGTPTIRFPPQSPAEGTFFSAEDILRASVYTTGTVDHDPRASVATTIYRSNAIVQPVPANVVRAGKANVVQVKTIGSASSTPHLGSAPPVPAIDPSHLKGTHLEVIPPSPAFSVGSTFLNKMNERQQETGSQERTNENKGLSVVQKRIVPGRAVQAVAAVVTESVWNGSADDGCDDVLKQKSQIHHSGLTTNFEESPFSDRHSLSNVPLPAGNGLPPVSNSRRVSRISQGGGSELNSTNFERRMSPFDDSNAVDKDKNII